MSLAQILAAQRLQKVLEEAQELENYVTLGRDRGLTVTWTQGAGLGGYDLMRERIGALIASELPELQQRVLANARAAVADAQSIMREELGP